MKDAGFLSFRLLKRTASGSRHRGFRAAGRGMSAEIRFGKIEELLE